MYFFFDIDGTLTNSNPGGIILPSTMETLKKLKENGHFVSIATGRSYRDALRAMKEADIHDCVCCGGNGLIVNDEVIHIDPLEKEKALTVIRECLEKGIRIGVMVDESGNLYSSYPDFGDYCPEVKQFMNIKIMDHDHYEDFDEIHKMFIGIKEGEEYLLTSFKEVGLHYARYHPLSMIIEPDDKYKGILDMIDYIGGNKEEIVVFGDGHNDLSMMKQAPISIAMGNAIDELKEIATFVTKDCKEDGIAYACEYFGWV